MAAEKKKTGWIILLVILVAGILLFPLSKENVTVKLYFENAQDGQALSVSLENSGGEVLDEELHVYGSSAEFYLQPNFYECETITIGGMDTDEILVSVKLYSGSYDVDQDKLCGEILLEGSAEDGTLVLGEDICTEIAGFLDKNAGLRVKLLILVLAVYMIAFTYRFLKGRKYVKIGLWIFLIAYVLVGVLGDRYDLLERYNAVSNTEDIAQLKILGDTVEVEFEVTEDDFAGVIIDFDDRLNTVYEDVGVRLVRADTGEEVYSRVFTALSLSKKLEIRFFLPEEIGTVSEGTYRLSLEPLDPDISNTIGLEYGEDENLAVTILYGPSYSALIVLIGSAIGIFLLFLLAFRYRIFRLSKSGAVKLIYAGVFLYAIIQILYYGKYVGNTPDEEAHLSYIVYLLEHRTLIPDFANMPLYEFVNGTAVLQEGTVNQLGHPPLYYWILALVQMMTGAEQLHVNLLRGVSAGLGMLGILIFFVIGYRTISRKHPYIHLLYAAACVSVPFITYGFSGVNNDVLSFLGAAVAFLGMVRFEKRNRDWLSYLLLGSGLCITIFSKLTAGIVLVIAYLIYLIYICVKDKNIRCVLNKKFLIVLPFLAVIAVYFGTIYLKWGSVQPGLAVLDFEYYRESSFYVDFEYRIWYTLRDYFAHFWLGFLDTWTIVYSHVSVEKTSVWFGLDRIVYLLLLVCPVALAFKKKNPARVFCLGIFAGMGIAVLMQFYSAYKTYYFVAGYGGGYQSRYYLCWVPILAYVFAHLFLMAKKDGIAGHAVGEKQVRWAAGVCVFLLFYGSFIYTLLNYIPEV
ncbi:MAG: glycosyltransferase family 39 protein [Clostridiales bacterium]|nr:glycosyltransferase family 39 protein [Clostridiales bacterium]